jgi:tryptophanyl-tRNA synthetase
MVVKKRVLSGIQSSGLSHLGNYFGAIANWIKLQQQYESYFMIADLHALTTVEVSDLARFRRELVIDLLASGVDPAQCHLFAQSHIPAHSQAHVLLSMMTPIAWLERIPSYKDKIEELKGKDLNTYGFLGYPVLQAADILLYDADFVPVGRDQLPHLELTRMIARRFNALYGTQIKEPAELLTSAPVLPGLDGRKMSKSYGNAVFLSDSPADLSSKIMKMMTDPARKRRTDPGNAEICPVFEYHRLLNESSRCAEIKRDCANASLGCVDCKKEMIAKLQITTTPIYEKRQSWLSRDAEISEILQQGASQAAAVANAVLNTLEQAVHLK